MLTELRTKSQITIPKDIVMKMGLRAVSYTHLTLPTKA